MHGLISVITFRTREGNANSGLNTLMYYVQQLWQCYSSQGVAGVFEVVGRAVMLSAILSVQTNKLKPPRVSYNRIWDMGKR